MKLDAHVNKMVEGRKIRRRKVGDGGGIDIGIVPGAYLVTMSKHIDGLNPETKKRLLDHVKHHVDEAMKPLIRLMERAGDDEHKISLFRDIGANSLRSVIEHLEAEVND